MREISSSVTFEIQPGETVPMRVVRSTRLTVHGAPVWATRSNDIEDYFLEPGDKLKLRRGERLWLSAEGGTACVGFSVRPLAGQAARSWFGRARARASELLHGGWRTV